METVFPMTTEERRWSWNTVFPVLKGWGSRTLVLGEVKNTKNTVIKSCLLVVRERTWSDTELLSWKGRKKGKKYWEGLYSFSTSMDLAPLNLVVDCFAGVTCVGSSPFALHGKHREFSWTVASCKLARQDWSNAVTGVPFLILQVRSTTRWTGQFPDQPCTPPGFPTGQGKGSSSFTPTINIYAAGGKPTRPAITVSLICLPGGKGTWEADTSVSMRMLTPQCLQRKW